MPKLISITGAAALAASVCGGARAAETITYTYDAKGRLIKAERAGTVNNGVKTEYEHDKANNRRRVKVTGAPWSRGSASRCSSCSASAPRSPPNLRDRFRHRLCDER